jgi:hypothetical protein
MIRLVLPVHPTEGYGMDLTCPVVTCDACGQTIIEHGNVLWNPEDDRDLFFTHKGACDRRLDPTSAFYSRELGQWLRQLVNNFERSLLRTPLPVGCNGEEFIVTETRTLADNYGVNPEKMSAVIERAVAMRDAVAAIVPT